MGQNCCEDKKEADHVRTLVRKTSEITGKFNLSDYIGFCENMDLQGLEKRLEEVRENFDTMTERIMTEHEEARKNRGDDDGVKDLIDILLDIAEDESSEIRLTR